MNKHHKAILYRTLRFIYRNTIKRTSFGPKYSDAFLEWYWKLKAPPVDRVLIDGAGHDAVGLEVSIPNYYLSPPLNFAPDPGLALNSRIIVIIPSLRLEHMSGGPNTALLLASYLAELGESIAIVSSDAPAYGREEQLYSHMGELLGRPVPRDRIELIDGFDRSVSVPIGAGDIFLATAWWTAQMARNALRHTIHDGFIYLIQDFEPILHSASTFHARALETYGFQHIPVINTRLLLDHLAHEGSGCYAGEDFVSDALVFNPALDRTQFHPTTANRTLDGKRVLLFYSRPTKAERNLFEIGLSALARVVSAGLLFDDTWEVWGMGEDFKPIPLGNGMMLRSLPWMSFEDYAKRMRESDLLLSLMLSPHPSYPPLEMAACGNMVVTNSCSVKTEQRLRSISPNILVAEPNADDVARVLMKAVGRINAGLPSFDPSGRIDSPATWDESLLELSKTLKDRISSLRLGTHGHGKKLSRGYPVSPTTPYEEFRLRRLEYRRRSGEYFQKSGLLSFITSAYDTAPEYLEELAASVFLQDGGTGFEWVILDNGSTRPETINTLNRIADHPCVRLERVEKNLGIIGGMREALSHATGEYVLPLDSDDLLEPDCVHVVTRFLYGYNFPEIVYTDEDKLEDSVFHTPYFKPDWDPVLFINSCYIAHLCVINRKRALELGLYEDNATQGCHDWDTFIRFINAGFTPQHIPEVLYSWRMHSESTAGNIESKSYLTESHRNVLQGFLDYRGLDDVALSNSPLFSFKVDWRFSQKKGIPVHYKSVGISTDESISTLSEKIAAVTEDYVHFIGEGVTPDHEDWIQDAVGVMRMFPDTVLIGGPLHNGETVLGGFHAFGFDWGAGCPDVGRSIKDPGYFAQMWKIRSVSSVGCGHCLVRTSFLLEAMAELERHDVSVCLLGPWLGALAREDGKRAVYSPFMSAIASNSPEETASTVDRFLFLSRFDALLPERSFLSPRLGLSQNDRYLPVPAEARKNHLESIRNHQLPYAQGLAYELRSRSYQYPTPVQSSTFTLLTTIYEKTDVVLLEELADSVLNQSLPPAQWVIVAHGPIPQGNLDHIQARAASEWRADLIIVPEQLGIIRAMRRALSEASSDYVVPLDADDLLTADALQILACEIERHKQPDLIYSDEDIFVDGEPQSPFRRRDFDPVLNLESSTIWHLCAIKRETAYRIGVYSDEAAMYCHDWDTIMRIHNDGGRIEHVPAILYHWRHHPVSTTNIEGGNPQSFDSVRHVLESQIKKHPRSNVFYVEEREIFPGARELYIARKGTDLPPFFLDW